MQIYTDDYFSVFEMMVRSVETTVTPARIILSFAYHLEDTLFA